MRKMRCDRPGGADCSYVCVRASTGLCSGPGAHWGWSRHQGNAEAAGEYLLKSCFCFLVCDGPPSHPQASRVRTKYRTPGWCTKNIHLKRVLMYFLLPLEKASLRYDLCYFRGCWLSDPVSKVIMAPPVARSLIVQEEETCGPFPVSAGCSVLVRPWCSHTLFISKS